MKRETTIKEYDNEGKLVKETTTIETYEDNTYPQVIPYCPSVPTYPPQPFYTTVTI
jgi:hypothetical protein